MTVSERTGGGLAAEQAALRRVATLVAHDVPPGDLFAAVAREVGALMGADTAAVVRFEPDGMATLMGGHHARRRAGARFAPDEGYVVASVRRTGHAARFDTQDPTAIEMPDAVRQEGICSGAASPIVVDGRLWGTITVASLHRSLPAATERRLGDFTELVATAIAGVDARAEVDQLAREHAALRRVATLVARGVPASELFDAVAREVGMLLGGDFAGLARFDDGFAIGLGMWAAEGEHPPIPPRWPIQAGDPATTIEHTPAPTRWNDWTDVPGPIAAFFREIGVRSSVGTPIVVEGRVWGALALHSKRSAPFPPDTETRMQEFTDLVGTAIANAQARGDLGELAEEQAALRRVATLVAQGTSPEQVFRAVADEVAQLLGCTRSAIIRFEEEGAGTVVASLGGPHAAGQRVELDTAFVGGAVRETGRSARFDTDDPAGPNVPELARAHGVRSAVASPVVVESGIWGAIAVGSLERRLPATVERRLTAFTELVATAVANAQARGQVRALADEQAALRRVATLVAQEASAEAVLTAIAEECGRLFGTTNIGILRYEGDRHVVLAITGQFADIFPVGSETSMHEERAASRVYRTGAPVRIEDFMAASETPVSERLRALGLRSEVATPIMVEGRLWGAMVMATTRPEPLPPDTEARLGQFTELMATTIANTESRARVDRLTGEQDALRRLATLVAQGTPLETVFAKVAEEVASTTFGEADTALWRDDGDGSVTAVAARAANPASRVRVGMRLPLDGESVTARVLRDGRPQRIDDFSQLPGSIAERARALGMRSAVGCPIVVGSRTWGAMTVATYGAEPFAPEVETRVARFSDLVATAIANAEARAEVQRLAEEQAALRRVATLVAKEASLPAVFARVAEEASRALGHMDCRLWRDVGDGTATLVAVAGSGLGSAHGVGMRRATGGDSTIGRALREGRPSRVDDYSTARGPSAAQARSLGLRASLACPIFVGERAWGAMQVVSYDEVPIPLEVETRIMRFSDLVATAIANSEARAEVVRLAEEQAALRRVATLVARGAPAGAVFDTVAVEIKRLLEADHVVVCRFEPGNELTVLAHRAPDGQPAGTGTRISHEGDSVDAVVWRTRRPARVESYAGARGRMAERARSVGVRVAVGTPIVVDGRLWGVVSAGWSGEESPPVDTERRMAQFGQLLDTAIANADSRDQLTASRARLMTASDDARRRVVRDLHDGAQQQLVHAIVTLKLAQRALREGDGRVESLLGDALSGAEHGNQELRELAHGILPSVLTHGGLRAAVRSLATRLDVPMSVRVPTERFRPEVEASAYFIVAEALTNVVKHAQAEGAEVSAAVEEGMLRVEVRDDGRGGADSGGHGLVGMSDRVSALGGRLEIDSPRGAGTRVTASLPLLAAE